jgi:hypothetical protein
MGPSAKAAIPALRTAIRDVNMEVAESAAFALTKIEEEKE